MSSSVYRDYLPRCGRPYLDKSSSVLSQTWCIPPPSQADERGLRRIQTYFHRTGESVWDHSHSWHRRSSCVSRARQPFHSNVLDHNLVRSHSEEIAVRSRAYVSRKRVFLSRPIHDSPYDTGIHSASPSFLPCVLAPLSASSWPSPTLTRESSCSASFTPSGIFASSPWSGVGGRRFATSPFARGISP